MSKYCNSLYLSRHKSFNISDIRFWDTAINKKKNLTLRNIMRNSMKN